MAVTANALWREGVRKLIGEAVEMAMALGLSGVFSSVFVRGVSSGRTTDNDFSFSPLRETAEAMAYSLSLGLLYLGLLCGNGLVSARSELFTPGTALTTTSETFVISHCHSSPI